MFASDRCALVRTAAVAEGGSAQDANQGVPAPGRADGTGALEVSITPHTHKRVRAQAAVRVQVPPCIDLFILLLCMRSSEK